MVWGRPRWAVLELAWVPVMSPPVMLAATKYGQPDLVQKGYIPGTLAATMLAVGACW